MAPSSTPPAPPQEITSSAPADLDETAGQRLIRQFAVFVACGYLAYLLLTVQAIAASLSVMHLWWTIPAVCVVFGPGIALGPLAWRATAQQLRLGALLATIGYLAAVATWWFGWNGTHLTGTTSIWFSLFCGLAAIAAALALRPSYAFIVLVIVVTSTVAINHAARNPSANGPLIPDMAWAFAFSLVYFAAAVMGLRTAAVLDATRAQAYAATAAAAASQARTDERVRFDQLTHDGVMTNLLSAARQGASPQLARQAQATLADLAVMRTGVDDADAPMSATDAVDHIRLLTRTATPRLQFVDATTGTGDDTPLPGHVVRAMAAAAAEAVRNSSRHAPTAHVVRVTVTPSPGRLRVTVADDGPGFDPDAVPADRFGIAVSIRQRMAQIGGTAIIDSAPTHGTQVTLDWSHS